MSLVIERMDAQSDAIAQVWRWRHDEWLHEFGFTPEQSESQLVEFLQECPPNEAALLARHDGRPAGTCLLVRDELDQRHDVTPWLAGLFVAPEFRCQRIGAALVKAIEDRARDFGFDGLYLYTSGAEEYYARLGWRLIEHFDWDGEASSLMKIDT